MSVVNSNSAQLEKLGRDRERDKHKPAHRQTLRPYMKDTTEDNKFKKAPRRRYGDG